MTPHSTDTRPRRAPDSEPTDESRPERPRRRWPWIVLVVAAVLGYLVFRGAHKTATGDGSAAAPAKGQAGARAVPVVAATARTGDLGVYLNGPRHGHAALNTVTVRSRVDGQLMRVSFKEGQLVHQGDLLAEIDPRPFQVQLAQAEGQAAKDRGGARERQARPAALPDAHRAGRDPASSSSTRRPRRSSRLEAALKSDQGQIDSAKLNLTYSRITAPITGASACGWWTPATWSTPPTRTASSSSRSSQPIAVVFTIPADSLPLVPQQMRAGRTLAVEACDRDLKNRLATGTLLAVDNQIDQTTGHGAAEGALRRTTTARSSRTSSSTRACSSTRCATPSSCPAAAVQRSSAGDLRLRGQGRTTPWRCAPSRSS